MCPRSSIAVSWQRVKCFSLAADVPFQLELFLSRWKRRIARLLESTELVVRGPDVRIQKALASSLSACAFLFASRVARRKPLKRRRRRRQQQ